MTAKNGDLFDQRFLLIEKLGAGGTGEVWRALDQTHRREVALKLLHPHHAKAQTVLERFVREAKILTALDHPNIGRALDWSERTDPPFMALEFIKGIDLGAYLSEQARASQKPPVEETDDLAQQLFAALEYAHRHGVVHRDLKPANVMLEGEGKSSALRVVDFGIAKVFEEGADSTTSGRTLGTFTYLAPEQLDASGVDHRADIFALGTLLFELLTLHRAWLRDLSDRPIHCLDGGLKSAPMNAPLEVMRRILTGSRPMPSLSRRELPSVFDPVISKALSVRRDDRYADIATMRAAWDKAVIAAAPGRIIKRTAAASTPSMTATEVIKAELPLVMPQTLVIDGSTSLWTREATNSTPKSGTEELGSKTNTDPVPMFPDGFEPSDPAGHASGGATQPPKLMQEPTPKRISNPPRPSEAPFGSTPTPLEPQPTPMPASISVPQLRPARRFDFLAGSLVLSATILIVTLLVLDRFQPRPVSAPIVTTPAPAPPPVAPTVSPAASPLPAPPAPLPEPPTEARSRRRATSAKPAAVMAGPPPPPPSAPEAPFNPHRATLGRLRAAPADAKGLVQLGEDVERDAKNTLAREQAATISACVGQSRMMPTSVQGLDKLGQCIDKLEVLHKR